MALRSARIARVAVATGSLSLLFVYAAPLVRAFVMPLPPRVHVLDPLTVPSLRFPAFAIPKPLPKAPAAGASAPLLAARSGNAFTGHRSPTSRTVRVPVVKDFRNLTLPAGSSSSSFHGTAAATSAGSHFHGTAAPTSAGAAPPVVTSAVGANPGSVGGAVDTSAQAPGTVPIVTSNVGVEPAAFAQAAAAPAAAAPAAPATPQAQTTPAPTQGATTDPAAAAPAGDPSQPTYASPASDPAAAVATMAELDTSTPTNSSSTSSTATTDSSSTTTDPGSTTTTSGPSAPDTFTASTAPAPTDPSTSTSSSSTTSSTASGSGATPSSSTPPVTPPVTPSAPAPWTVSLASDADHSIAISVSGGNVSVTVDGTATTEAAAGVTSVAITGGDQADTLTVDASVVAAALPVSFDGGAGNNTVDGPSVDTNWSITGAGAGNFDSVSFTNVESLVGAAGNKDTFTVESGGSVASIDGGADGYDSLIVAGQHTSVVSTPTDAHSGTLVVDGTAIRYAGLEPLGVDTSSQVDITINGADLGGSQQLLDKDYLKVGPYSDPSSPTPACQVSGACIQVQNYAGPFGSGPQIAEFQYFVISSAHSLTLNGGLGTDTVEFTGDYRTPGASLTVNAESIKVDSGFTVDAGTSNVNFYATSTDDGIDALGIDSTLLGDTASIELDGAALNGNTLDLEASSGNAKTTVDGGSQNLTGTNDTLTVATVDPFLSSGKFTIDGILGSTCTFTGTSGHNQFTGVSGCSGTPLDKAAVTSVGIIENGSGKGITHAGLQLIYSATINVHGGSTITATGDVTLASTVNVTATANSNGIDKGTWTSGLAVSKGDVVTDPSDGKRYAAQKDITGAADTTNPSSAPSTDWGNVDNSDSSVAASSLIATGTSQLSGTSTISAGTHTVKITSKVTTNLTTNGDSSLAGSGAGISVAVLNTDSEAFIDSTATTPVTAGSLTVSADTDNTAPTTGIASVKGAKGNDESANSSDRANGQSKTSDNTQNLTAALAVTVLTATTQAYISPNDTLSTHTISTSGGTDTIHAGAKNNVSATADAGNVKFSPDAPTLTKSSSIGSLQDGKTYYYDVTATFTAPAGESLPSAEANITTDSTGSNTNEVVLHWTAVQGATGYNVYRGDSAGNETLIKTITTLGVTTYTDSGGDTPGSAKPPTTDPSSGVGIAVAVTVAVVNTKAYLSKNLSLQATTVTAETTAPSASSFAATATSGAGGSSVGVAGSIAVIVVVDNTTSDVEGTTAVNLNGADLNLNATANLGSTALATAKQATDGSASGVGASVAVNIVNDNTIAGLPLHTTISSARNLTINATDTDAMTTTANGGASAGSGSLALSAQAAISISNVTTSATVNPGPDLTLTGGLTAHATQTSSVTTKASGATKGGTAGIGLSLGLEAANHLVDSQLERNLLAAGAVSFTADGSSSNDTEATASSAGAPGKKDGGDSSTDNSNKDVNGKADQALGDANTTSASAGPGGKSSGTSSTPAAKSGDGGGTTVTVAAAAAIAIVTAKAISGFSDGPLNITTTGLVSFNSSEDTDSTAKASGSGVKATTANIGAAAAINLVKVTNTATVGLNDVISSNGLTLAAAMRSSGGADGKNTLDTEATAGAGNGAVAIAGSLALTIADIETSAELKSNGARAPPGDNLNGHDLSLSATAVVSSTDKAMAQDKDASTVGVGAGAAINLVNDTTTASIDDGAALTGVANVSLTATDTDTQTTYAEAGTAGGAGSTVSFTADAAISLPTVTTSATINGGTLQTLTASGTITVSATQTASATTTAKANAVNGTVVIGLALALAIPDDEVFATDSRTISGTTVSFSATGSSNSPTEADASATGAKGDANGAGGSNGDGSGKDVNGKADQQLSSANGEAGDNGVSGSKTTNTNNAKATTSDSNSSGGNTVTVAGAAAINIVTTRSEASLADSANVTATGVLSLKTLANTDATATGSGKADAAGTVGIGVGVAVNDVHITNLATTNNATVNSNGLDVEAGMRTGGNDQIQRYDGTNWQTIDQGETFPEQPSDGDFFQLTKGAPATAVVDGDNQTIDSGHTTLKVKSTAGFTDAGSFTVGGFDGTCNYTSKDGTNFKGVSGCSTSSSNKIADKATVTSTLGTKVTGAQTISASSTLNVLDTTNFATTGMFTVDGIDGTCSYNGTTGSSLQNVTGCTGSVKDGAPILVVAKAPGIYKWNDSTSSWDNQLVTIGSIATSDTFPASPSSGDYYKLAEHGISAKADSGAGGDSSTVSIAGALALNIVSNNTSATVGGSATVNAGTGDVTLKATNNEEDHANADSDAESGKVGIGASAAIQVLNSSTTRAAIEDGAGFSCAVACGTLTISAISHHTVETEDKAGSAGGTLALSPSVSIAIVSDQTSAHVGTGGDLKFTGAATISASEELDSTLTADASAGGKNVAIGAAVSINLIEPTTIADVTRNLQASAITISSTTETSSDATAKASASGEKDGSKTADKQSNDQVQNNPSTKDKTPKDGSGNATPQAGDSTSQANSTSSSNTGDSNSGGVGIAAAVAINWVVSNNTASVGSGVHLTATGDLKVSAVNLTKADAFGLGLAINSSSDVSIGAALGLNVAQVHNTAVVNTSANLSGGSITVEAVNPASKDDEFIVWAIAAADSKNDASVSASVGVEVLSVQTKAYVDQGATLDSPGNITIHAQAPLGLLNLAVSGGLSSDGAAVGGAFAVNVLNTIDTQAYVDSGSTGLAVTHVDAGGALQIKAEASLSPLTPQLPSSASRFQGLVPMVSSVALGGSAGGGSDPAVTGSVVVDVISITTNAEIKPYVVVNGTRHGGGGQTVEVTAQDDTHLINVAGAVALSSEGAGIAVSIIVDVINKDVTASIDDNANVWAGGSITVQALSTERLFELSVGGAASGSSAAVTGSFVVVVMGTGCSDCIKAYIGAATIHSGGQTHVKASDIDNKLELYAGNVTIGASSAGVGIAVTVLVRDGNVDAHVASGANLNVGSALIEAIQNENQILVAGAGAGGSSAGVAGSVVVDVPNNTTTATLDGTTVSSGAVKVSASDTTNDVSVAGQLVIGGSAGVGVGIDVEAVTKDTEASIAPSASVTTTSSAGDVTVSATSQETFVQVAAGLSIGGSASVAVNAGISVYSITTNATIGNHANVNANGSVGVTAAEALQLDVVAGNIAIGGSAGVGVAASVPVITKNTNATIDDFATVTGAGNGGGLTVNDGSFTVTGQDTRFNGATAVSGDTIDLGYTDGLSTGDQVIYDDGNSAGSTANGNPIGGLMPGHAYFVIVINPHEVQLADSAANAKSGTQIHLTQGSGEGHRLVPADEGTSHGDSSPRFAPSSDVSSNTINLPYTLSLSAGDPVVYGAGGGAPIGGLTDGATYYAIPEGGNSYELADSKCHATGSSSDCGGSSGPVTPITLDKTQASGRSHSLVQQGKTPSSDASQEGPQTVTPGHTTLTGVLVTATNSDDIAAVGVSAAIGGSAGVGVSGTVSVITVNTNATIGKSAHVNDNSGSASGPNVFVAAGNEYHQILAAASVAIGGGAGVGASVDVALLHLNANALIDNSAVVRATNTIIVQSSQSDTVDSITIAGGGGTVGVGAAVNVLVIYTHVYASTGTGATIVAGNNAAILANDDTTILGVSGGVAGGFVGVGAAVSVLSLNKDTEAFVGSGTTFTGNAGGGSISGISDGTETSSSFGFGSFNGAAVQASSSENIFGLVIAVGAGFVGVAVPVGVTIMSVTTEAYDAGSITSSGGNVNISALDKMVTITIAGGVGAGFVGVGAAVDIGVANSNTTAFVAGGASVTANSGNVDVNGLSIKSVTTYAIAIGGGFVGVAGAVSVWSLGTNGTTSFDDGQGDSGNGTTTADPNHSADSEADGQVGGGSGSYQSILSGTTKGGGNSTANATNSRISGHTSDANSSISTNAPTGSPTHTALTTTLPAGTSAKIDGNVHAVNVTVNARDNTALSGIVGSAAGGAVGVGASVVIGNIDSETDASLGGNANVTATGNVVVYANLTENSNMVAFAGAGGIVAVAAQVTVLNDSSHQKAHIDSGAIVNRASGANGIDVKAENQRDLSSLTIGGSIGLVSAGAAIAIINMHGGTQAWSDGSIGQGGTVTSLTVEAHDHTNGHALAIGVAAGIGVGLAGSVALMTVDPTVSGELSGNVTTTGTVSVLADTDLQASTESFGVAVGGGAGIGVAVATASTNPTVSATVTGGSHVAGGGLTVTAERDLPGKAVGATSTYANAVSGGGGILVGINGSLAITNAGGSVTATVGNNVHLPNGDVTISANSMSRQDAVSSGVAIGFVGIGATISHANSSTPTTASLGSGIVTGSSRTGNLTVQSFGVAFNLAQTTSGAGGVVAGNAAEAHTHDTGYSETTVGNSTLYGGDVTISSRNISNYDNHANSVGAGVLQASGAFADNTTSTHSHTTVNGGTTITATGTVEISSSNEVNESLGAGISVGWTLNVEAAGGGVFSGSAASSESSVTGNSTVTLGDNITISSTNVPLSNGAAIGIDASSRLLTNDNVDLETGGAIALSGVDSSVSGNLTNDVEIGTHANFYSTTNVGLGTSAIVAAHQEADESTWGLAAVGSASSTVDVTTNETIHVGSFATITGLGNVDIEAGQTSDGSFQTDLEGSSSAQGYIRGLIAVPLADATTNLNGNSTVTLDGATILSGMNTTVSADPGTPAASADGTGHGYELGFIPITDGSSNSNPNTSSTVTINGSITAGAFRSQIITIGNNGRYDGFFTNASDVSQVPGIGAPASWTFDPSFDAVGFLNSHFNAEDAMALIPYVSSVPVPAIHFGPLFAAGGDAEIKAGTLHGTATIDAYGEPTISITNASPDYVVLDGTAIIPFLSVGHVVFAGLGHAGGGNSIVATEHNPDVGGQITITDTFGTQYGTPQAGPGIIQNAEISNLGGSVLLNDDQGSIIQANSIYAQQVNINAPNGAVAITVTGTEITGGSPLSEWDAFTVFPGGDPHTALVGSLNATAAIGFVADSEHPTATTVSQLMSQIIGPQSSAIWGVTYSTPTEFYVGDCVPAGSNSLGNCDGGNANSLSTQAGGNGGHTNEQDGGPLANLPVNSLLVTTNNSTDSNTTGSCTFIQPSCPASANSAITSGGLVIINATTVDLDSKIIAGPPTDWSVYMPSGLLVPIMGGLFHVDLPTYQFYYQHGLVSSPTVSLPVTSLLPTDTPITATYDARTGQISLSNVKASAGGGLVRIRGQIVNTNNFGDIKVNGGLGQVTVDNQTGVDLAVNNIYTGTIASVTAAESHIQLIDSLAGQQTLYSFIPGQGINVYTSSNLSATIADLEAGAPASHISGQTTQYDPTAGYRIQWQEQASLTRSLDESSGQVVGSWVFANAHDDPNNPWGYFQYTGSAAGTFGSADLPSSTLIHAPGEPLFQETISGNAFGGGGYAVFHYGCGDNIGDGCDNGFRESTQNDPIDHTKAGEWDYYYPGGATITLTMSVAADLPIKIEFGGHDRGLISITSNSNIYLDGQLTNPNGDTNITSTNGSIFQGPSPATTLTNTLTLIATGSVGTSNNPLLAALTTVGPTGGDLSSTSGSAGTYLTLGSGANIGTISSGGPSVYGDVVVKAAGALRRTTSAGDPTLNVSGRDITLDTSVGGIGTISNPLLIAAHQILLADGAHSHGVVNADAVQSIGLTQVAGPVAHAADFAVGEIISHSGDVSLTNTVGGIFDERGETPAQVLSEADATTLWTRLQLTSALGATTLANESVTHFENQVDQTYVQYWQLRADGTVSVDGNTLTLSLNGIANLRPATKVHLGLSGDPSDAQVQTYAQSLFHADVSFFDATTCDSTGHNCTPNVDPLWRTDADWVTFNPSFHYTATGDQTTDLTQNAVWDENQLRFAVNAAALQPGSTTIPPTTPNVSGNNVTIHASGSIGRLAPPITILATDLFAGTLTADQQNALALAAAPGDVILLGTDVHGNPIVIPFTGTVPAGDTLTSIQVNQTAPLFVSAIGTFNATSDTGSVFAQSTSPNLNIGFVSAATDASLVAPQDILSAGTSATQIHTGHDLTLLAAAGDLAATSSGGSHTPLVIDVQGTLVSAGSGGILDLQQNTKTLSFERIAAGGDAFLTVTGAGHNLIQTVNGVGIAADNLTLNVNHDIGTSGQAVTILLAGGTLTADAGNNIWIDESAGSSNSNGDLHLTHVFSSNGNVTLSADGSIFNVAGGPSHVPASVHGNTINLNAGLGTIGNIGAIGTAGNDLNVDSGFSGAGLVNVNATDNTYVIETLGDLNLGTSTDTGLAGQEMHFVSRNGNITNGLSSGTNVTAGKLWLAAAGSVGTSTSITTSVGSIGGRAFAGNIWIDQFGQVVIGNVLDNADATPPNALQATGTITFTAHSPITIVAGVLAGGTITITSVDSVVDDLITINPGVTVQSTGSTVNILSGDGIFQQSGSTIESPTEIYLEVDHASTDPGIGGNAELDGTLIAPLIVVQGNADPDTLTLHPDLVIGHVEMFGGGGNDVLTVNLMSTLDLLHKFNSLSGDPASLNTGAPFGLRNTIDLDGQGGGDQYIVNTTGTTDYIVNVHDSGAYADGVDTLTINGSPNAQNVFLLRANFVARMQPMPGTDPAAQNYGPNYERINYDPSINLLQVNGGALADYFYVDDNSAITGGIL